MAYNSKSGTDAIAELFEGTSRLFQQMFNEANHPAYLLPELQYGQPKKTMP